MDVLFYHLMHVPLERVLPDLLEKTLAKGWRAIIEVGSPEQAQALDNLLWSYSDESFLPHDIAGGEGAGQSILITAGEGNPNGADIRFFVETGSFTSVAGYQRLVYLFNGNDDGATERARIAWREAQEAGLDATYWQQNEAGRWEKKA